jgi:hypothetical protein
MTSNRGWFVFSSVSLAIDCKDPDVVISEGSILFCVEGDTFLKYRYRTSSKRKSRPVRIWMCEGRLVFDMPARAEDNLGMEDDIMNVLEEVQP